MRHLSLIFSILFFLFGCDPSETREDSPPSSAAQCLRECESPSDCTTTDIPPFGPDNWSCSNNACVYLGCNPGDCFEGDTCETLAEYKNVPFCIVGCTQNEECGLFVGAQGKVVCSDGLCRPQGCIDDAECNEFNQGYVCKNVGAFVNECRAPCVTQDDCDGDAPQKCGDGYCQPDTCLSDEECRSEGFKCLEP